MKTWLWVVLMTSSAVLAITLVWILSENQSSGGPTASPSSQETAFELPGKDEPWPKVVLDTSEYDFGMMDTHQKHEHSFVVRNEGDAPLKLKVGDTTCKCTIGDLFRKEVAPGESTKVHLQWETLGRTENFRQTAEILTNDPDRPQFGLIITGKVRSFLKMIPSELVFTDASVQEKFTRSTTIESQTLDHFELTKIEATSEFIDYEAVPANPQGLEVRRAMSGYEINVAIKKGFPIGRFFERVTIHTDIEDVEPMQLIIKGMVSGDITVYGSQWNQEMGFLRMGSVSRDKGETQEVHLYGKGPYRDLQPEDFTIYRNPEFLKVQITRDEELTGPTAPAHFIVLIEVPPNSPPVTYLGSDDNPLGEVRLEPNSSDNSEAVGVRLGVQFNVQQ